MGLTTTAPPDSMPITLDEAKLHLRVDGAASDDLIATLIAAATDYVERETRQSFINRGLTLTLDRFPAGRTITLPRPPLVSVASISFVGPDGVTRIVSPSTYVVDTTIKPGRIVLNNDWVWPDTSTNANSVSIAYTAGYGADSDAVPELIKAAIKLLVGLWFENREAAASSPLTPVPMAVESIVQMFAFPEVVG